MICVHARQSLQNYWVYFRRTSGYEEKSIMEIEWVRIAYSKWRCFCYIHGGMIVKNRESGVREQKIGWNKNVMAKKWFKWSQDEPMNQLHWLYHK